ncbi:MAG: LysR family transcriptional regulator [Erysipelotrichaceae bacterium]
MLDYRVYTFLTLCEQMNYHQTAIILNMSQPAVSQHIRYLENELNCKLFNYENKRLTKTKQGKMLEEHVRSLVYNDKKFKEALKNDSNQKIRIGATKSIGEYLIKEDIIRLNQQENLEVSLMIDNTRQLLQNLKNAVIDFALIEGFFDKQQFDYQLYKVEKLVGVVSKESPLANKKVTIEQLFNETLILREEGSGTRDIFELLLKHNNYTIEQFNHHIVISSPEMIKSLIKHDVGISFMYESLIRKKDEVATFEIKDQRMIHELNFVYLKDTCAKANIELFKNR